MKTREEYVRPYQIEFEEFVQHVTDICKDAGYSSYDEAYETIMNQPATNDEDGGSFNGWKTSDQYWISLLGQGLYEYEKPLIKAHRRYDRIIEKLASKNKYNPVIVEELLEMKRRDERAKAYLERLASKNKYNPVIAEKLLEMKRRDERVRRYLEEANSRHDEMIDELVSKYKTDDGGNNNV